MTRGILFISLGIMFLIIIGLYLYTSNKFQSFQPYARYNDDIDKDGPDMYGPVIVANQVLMMLKE